MGSSPESIRFLLQQLQCRPHTLSWCHPRCALILRQGHNHKLGFHFKTYPCGEDSETVTVVVRVKEDCHLVEGSLQVGDRIVAVGTVDVRGLQEPGVIHVFRQSQEAAVHLQVSAMSTGDHSNAQIKRFLSTNSGASSGSVTSSVDSGERPQVKRFQKSNSTETPSSPTFPAPPSPPSLPVPPTAAADRPRLTPHPSDPSQRGAGGDGDGGVVVAPPARRLDQRCPPRGFRTGTACSGRQQQGYPFHSPLHLSCGSGGSNNNTISSLQQPPSSQHVHSLPIKTSRRRMMEGGSGDIVLPDDIVLCETDINDDNRPCSSLPPLPNTATPSLTQSRGSGGGGGGMVLPVNVVSTGIGGAMESLAASWGGGGSNSVQSQSRSLGVEVCRAPGCTTQRTCLWHRFVYMYPQYVVWEPLTKTVQLQKHEQSSSFGFKYKVKKYDGSAQDGSSAEMFALVTEVAAGGVAWMLLFAGDWIRSINGTPVNTPEEAFFGADFRNLSSLRLVIQRPQRLMARGVAKLRPLAASLGISLHIPPPAPGPANNVNDANAASPALDSVSTYHVSRDAAMGVVDRGGPGADDAMGVGGGRTRNSFDPLLDRYPRMGQSPGEHIPLASLSRPPVVARGLSTSDRCPLPQARVVVCGAHGSAANFARGLLAENSAWGVNLDPDAPVQSFQLSLRCDGCSVGGGGADPGTRVWSSQRACLTSLVKEWESRGGGGVECGGASSRCVNVELYVVNDEEFFHHCCPWMLPSASLLVLTFDVDKLLNQPQMETSRLASMTHTLQACAGYAGSVASASPSSSSSSTSSQILLYGVPSGSQRDVSAEEVQVMFYVTDLGSQLLEQYGLAVSIAVPTCPRSMAAARQAVFAACEGRLSTAPRCVSRVVDALCGGACGVKMFGGEMSGLVCQALGGDCEPAVVQCIVECLVDAGCLLPCGSSSSSSSRRPPSRETAEMQSDFLVPFHAFQALASLLGKSSLDACSIDIRQKWFKLISTGRLSRSELTDLLASEASPLTVEILEQLGIVYMMQATSSSLSSRVDSGFAEDARCEFVIPYFLQDDCGSRREEGDDEEGEGGGGRRGEGFVLRFKHAVSWRVYFEVLCNLSALPATEEVRVLGRCRAVVRHNRLRLALHWRREAGCDGLLVTVSRAQQSGGWGEKRGFRQELERLFGYFIPPTLPFMVQAVDSTSPTSRLPSRNCHSAAPVTPVLRPPCMDGPQEETYIKPVVEVEGEGQGGSGAYSNLPLTVLPWSVLNHTAMLLTIAMPTGHDWKSVAERAGKKMVEIYAYEAIPSREVPAMSFLREWILTGTVQQFLDILESLDRPDVRDLILNYLQGRNDKS